MKGSGGYFGAAGVSSGSEWWRRKKLPGRGTKINAINPGEAFADRNLIENRRNALFKAVKQRRPTKLSHQSFGEWHACVEMARISSVKGKWAVSMGFEIDGIVWLYPEEALFLLDCGALELSIVLCDSCFQKSKIDEAVHESNSQKIPEKMDEMLPNQQIENGSRERGYSKRRVEYCGKQKSSLDIPASIQRGMACIASDPSVMLMFLTYAHLRRSGYVVRRPTALSFVEDLGIKCSVLSVWQHTRFRGRKKCGRPDFHLLIRSNTDEGPTINVLSTMQERISPIGLKIAIVERANILIYEVSDPDSLPLRRKVHESDQFLLKQFQIQSGTVQDEPEPMLTHIDSEDNDAESSS